MLASERGCFLLRLGISPVFQRADKNTHRGTISTVSDHLPTVIHQYKTDQQSVYNTWFINNEERLKAFRSIRRGVIQVVDDIKNKKFGDSYRTLEKIAKFAT